MRVQTDAREEGRSQSQLERLGDQTHSHNQYLESPDPPLASQDRCQLATCLEVFFVGFGAESWSTRMERVSCEEEE
eukprot:5386525-Amphidinium_carterae.1